MEQVGGSERSGTFCSKSSCKTPAAISNSAFRYTYQIARVYSHIHTRTQTIECSQLMDDSWRIHESCQSCPTCLGRRNKDVYANICQHRVVICQSPLSSFVLLNIAADCVKPIPIVKIRKGLVTIQYIAEHTPPNRIPRRKARSFRCPHAHTCAHKKPPTEPHQTHLDSHTD